MFIEITDDDIRECMTAALAPRFDDDPDYPSQSWLFHSKFTCRRYAHPDGIEVEICRSHTSVTDHAFLHARYETHSILLRGEVAHQIAAWLAGEIDVTEPVGFRGRSPEVRFHESDPVRGAFTSELFSLVRNCDAAPVETP